MNLLLDLGNTRLKWMLQSSSGLHDDGALSHRQSDFGVLLREALQTLPPVERAWLSSVASPALTQEVIARVSECGVQVHRVGPPHSIPELRLAYAAPETLGVDRWLAMLAARRLQRGPLLVVCCGSAMTLDAIDGDGLHLGGLIAPSPGRMREALYARAPHLAGQSGIVTPFATSTADGVESGAVLAAAALIDRLVADTQRRVGQAPTLMLAGGGAAALRPWIMSPVVDAPNLVLKGLAWWAERT